ESHCTHNPQWNATPMTGFQLFTVALRIAWLAVIGSAFPQTSATNPLPKEKVIQLYQFEKVSPGLKGTTKAQVEQYGVDFELDSRTEQDFRNLGMDQDLVNTIRRQLKVGKLEVGCEPVECEVSINNVSVGRTESSGLTKSPVMIGLVTVTVTARYFQPQTKEVEIAPGPRASVVKFKLEPLKGGLNVTCKPEDCSLNITGPGEYRKIAYTTTRRLRVEDLSSGEYVVEAQAPGYLTKVEKVFVSAPDDASITLK